jgi:radical SAM superfamily enzyme YgiQ (UPF0313 family)
MRRSAHGPQAIVQILKTPIFPCRRSFLDGDRPRPGGAGSFRGCIRACRFCQAGYAYRPVRSRSAKKLAEQGFNTLKTSGMR